MWMKVDRGGSQPLDPRNSEEGRRSRAHFTQIGVAKRTRAESLKSATIYKRASGQGGVIRERCVYMVETRCKGRALEYLGHRGSKKEEVVTTD